MPSLFRLTAVLTLSLILAATSTAHGSHDHRLRLLVGEEASQLSVVVDAALFLEFDSNKDGALSAEEFQAQFDAINDFVDDKLVLLDAQARVIPPSLRDLPVQGLAQLRPEEALSDIKILRIYKAYDVPPGSLAVSLFDGVQGAPDYVIVSAEIAKYGQLDTGDLIISLRD